MKLQATFYVLSMSIIGSFFITSAFADFNYQNFGAASELTLNGAATFADTAIEPPEKLLRLTSSNGTQLAGSAFRSELEYVGLGFSTVFRFQIGEPAGLGMAEGFSFIIHNSPEAKNALGNGEGGLGYESISNSLVIEFDTYSNLENDDPPFTHVAVHSAGLAGNAATQDTRIGVPVPVSLMPASQHSVRIDYVPGTLRIYMDSPDNLILSVEVDLELLLSLNESRAWVGFTSGIGDGSANHDILSWWFLSDTPNTYAFEIDSANSSFSLDGVAVATTVFSDFTFEMDALPIMEQGPGALATNYSGIIWVELDDLCSPSSIIFKRADIRASINGQWAPSRTDGVMGMTAVEGNYGLAAHTNHGYGDVVGAIREEQLNLSSSGIAASVTKGEFPGTTQIWTRRSAVFEQFSLKFGDSHSSSPPTGFDEEVLSRKSTAPCSLVSSDAAVKLVLPVSVSFRRIGVFGAFPPNGVPALGVKWECTYTGTITATLDLPSTEIIKSYVIHDGWIGVGDSIDSSKNLLKEGAVPTMATYSNLINTSHGINAIAFDIENLAKPKNLIAADFEFQVSPHGFFEKASHPPSGWLNAPTPSSVNVVSNSPHRIQIKWPNNAIENRWLRITVRASSNTGLAEDQVYYLGHLLGEITGPFAGVYSVSFSDLTAIRSALGQKVEASSALDIDKNGMVNLLDISAARSNVGQQLTIISVP